MSNLEHLRRLINNDNVDVMQQSGPQQDQYQKVDKEKANQELQNREQLERVAQQIQGLPIEKQYEWVDSKKQQADKCYQLKQFQKALEIYLEALMGFQQQEYKEQSVKFSGLKYKILCNMCVVCIEQKKYQKGILLLKQAEDIQQTYRLFYLYSRCYELQQDYKDAYVNQLKAIKSLDKEQINQSIVQEYQDRLQRLNEMYQKQKKQSQEMYQRAFQINSQNQYPQTVKDTTQILDIQKEVIDQDKKYEIPDEIIAKEKTLWQ